MNWNWLMWPDCCPGECCWTWDCLTCCPWLVYGAAASVFFNLVFLYLWRRAAGKAQRFERMAHAPLFTPQSAPHDFKSAYDTLARIHAEALERQGTAMAEYCDRLASLQDASLKTISNVIDSLRGNDNYEE